MQVELSKNELTILIDAMRTMIVYGKTNLMEKIQTMINKGSYEQAAEKLQKAKLAYTYMDQLSEKLMKAFEEKQ